jgi:hypothetical protein
MRLQTLEVGPETRVRIEVVSAGSTTEGPRLDVRPPVTLEPVDPALARSPRGALPAGLEPRPEAGPPVADDVVITKPEDGDELVADHVTVLGRAPAHWHVTVLVSGVARGHDTANPAGHFTVPNVALPEGESELVAEARSPDGQALLRSDAVRVSRPAAAPLDPVAGGLVAAARAPRLELVSPGRRVSSSREAVLRLEGLAWDGASIEVEVNGRLAATDVAMPSGRFAVAVPLEPGGNSLMVEASDLRTGDSVRSSLLLVTRLGRTGRGQAPLPVGPAVPSRLERQGRTVPPGARPSP